MIKLFFESADDCKTDLLKLDEILKNNEELTKTLQDENKKFIEAQGKLVADKDKIEELTKKIKELEFQTRTDAASIAGLRDLRSELSTQVIKSRDICNNLKMDLLAERQLRRNLQLKLRELQPDDDNYNINKIDDNEYTTKPSQSNDELNGVSSSSPFPQVASPFTLGREIKTNPKPSEPEKRQYSIPNKLIKASTIINPKRKPLPQGQNPFSFLSSVPSTSAGSSSQSFSFKTDTSTTFGDLSNNSITNIFGEGPSMAILTTSPTDQHSPSVNYGFPFSVSDLQGHRGGTNSFRSLNGSSSGQFKFEMSKGPKASER